MPTRNYTSTSDSRTLAAQLLVDATSMTLNTVTSSTLPSDYPYTLVIDPDVSGLEEIVTVIAKTGTYVYTIVRASDGSSAKEHQVGAVVKHMVTARDLQESQNHIEANGAYLIKNDKSDPGVTTTNITKSLHGLGASDGVVVGTDKSQTLTNKTLTSAVLNNATITGTVAVSGTISNGTWTTPSISNPTIAGGTLSGTITSTANVTSSGSVTVPTGGSIAATGTGSITATNIDASKITGDTLASVITKSMLTKLGLTSIGIVHTDASGNLTSSSIVDADVSSTAAIAQSKINGLTTDLAAKAPLASPALTGTPTLNGTNVKRVVAGNSNVTFSSGNGTLVWGSTLPFTPSSVSLIPSVSTATLILAISSSSPPSTTSVGIKCYDDTGAYYTNATGLKIYWVAFE